MKLTDQQRATLRTLADYRQGAIEEVFIFTNNFDRDIIAGLVRTGLATAERQTVNTGGNTIEVNRIRITEAGQDALKGR
jgi:hypothetical protein